MTATETSRPKPARRTIVKGAAWAVPVVTVASAAPAMAASQEPIVPSFSAGTFCKHSSNDQAHGVICFQNTTTEDITLSLGNFVWTSSGSAQAYFSIDAALTPEATIPANTSRCLYVDAGPFPSLGNEAAVIYFTYPGAVGQPSVATPNANSMSNCNSTGQPGQGAPHPVPGP